MGTCLVGLAACHGDSGATERSSTAPSVPEVEFPVPTLDPGVMKVGAATRTSTGSPVGPLDPSGLRVQLDRCMLRGPGERVVNGRVVLPKGAHDVAATLELALDYGVGAGVDERSWRHRVTFSGSGSFAVVLPAIPIGSYEQVPGLVDPRTPYDDAARGCVATVLSASVPVATQRVRIEASIAREPFVYSAPADSIQALGIGAPLRDKQDARTISLYTVWTDRRTAIPKAWVPVVAGQRPALLSIAPSHPWCTTIRIGIGNFGDVREFPEDPGWITVTTRLNCGAPDDGTLFDTHEPVEGATGFTWAQTFNGLPDVARRTIGPYEVWVTGGSAITRERLAARRRHSDDPPQPRGHGPPGSGPPGHGRRRPHETARDRRQPAQQPRTRPVPVPRRLDGVPRDRETRGVGRRPHSGRAHFEWLVDVDSATGHPPIQAVLRPRNCPAIGAGRLGTAAG